MTATSQAHLIEAVARNRSILANAPISVFLTDRLGCVTNANDQYCALTGLSVEEAMGDNWMNALHPDDLMMLKSFLDRQNYERLRENRLRFVHDDGDIVYTHYKTRPIHDEHEELKGYVWILTTFVLIATRLVLERAGHTVRCAKNGQEALDELEKLPQIL